MVESYLAKDCKSSQANELTAIQLRHYLINNEDVRLCPRENCGYAGLVDIDIDTDRIECISQLECAKCGIKWYDPMQGVTQGIFLIRMWKSLKRFTESTANNMRKLLTATPCPSCGIMVQKDGGCQHMSCAKCAHSFCWSCLADWNTHHNPLGTTLQCGQARTMKMLLIALGIFLLFFKLEVSLRWDNMSVFEKIYVPESPLK